MQAIANFLRGGIKLYQWTLSPWLTPSCRYLPSCSEYAEDAILHFGPMRGGWLALKRLGRCHPWGGDGYDPVPLQVEKPTLHSENI